MTRHRPTELFQIIKHHRRYDRKTGKFIININYKTAPPKPTQRVTTVAEAFGLGLDTEKLFTIYDNTEIKITPTDIVYITGESGSGKSILLKTLEHDITHDMHQTAINTANIKPHQNKPIIETIGTTTTQALELLSRVGLNDAFLFLRTYKQLSDGQKHRYKIAKMIESNAQFWVMDEFCATLDRDTAKIVSFNVQKLARQNGKAVLAATTHTDLHEDLHPSVHIHKQFGKEIQVSYHANEPPRECSLLKQIRIEKGSKKDYNALASFHYRSHHVGAVRNVFRAIRGNDDELCGVIVYTYPAIEAAGRRKILPKMPTTELNHKLSNIMRVVVHPKYRTVGLGQKLVRQTLTQAETPYVETTAVMAKYNPFFERAGMTRIQETSPSKQAWQYEKYLEN